MNKLFYKSLYCFFALAVFCRAQDVPEELLKTLNQKHNAPKLPEVVLSDVVWYQLFVIPEVINDELYPIIVTVELKLDTTFRAKSGFLHAHAKRGKATSLICEKELSSKEAEEILRVIGRNEIFELPTKLNVARYEFFPHFGGVRYVFARKDQAGTKIVGRQDWSSEPLMNVAKQLTAFVLPFLEKGKKK
jgi:hypothetical protein